MVEAWEKKQAKAIKKSIKDAFKAGKKAGKKKEKGSSKVVSKRIIKQPQQITIKINKPVEDTYRSIHFKKEWEQDKRNLFFGSGGEN